MNGSIFSVSGQPGPQGTQCPDHEETEAQENRLFSGLVAKILPLVGIFILGGMCMFSTAHAQQATIEGTVVDSTNGEPLPGVNIIVQGTQQGTTTGAQGTYSLNVDPGSYLLQVSFIGYASQNVDEVALVRGGLQADLGAIRLQPDAAQLDEVEVTAERDFMEVAAHLLEAGAATDGTFTQAGAATIDQLIVHDDPLSRTSTHEAPDVAAAGGKGFRLGVSAALAAGNSDVATRPEPTAGACCCVAR